MAKQYWLGLAVCTVAVGLMGAGCMSPYAIQDNDQGVKTPPPVTDDANEPAAGDSGTVKAIETVTVSFTGTAFSPSNITIQPGDTVKFVNNSDSGMWPAADPHPTHTSLPSFDAKQTIEKGGSYSYTFTKVGTIQFHNHLAPKIGGTILVVQ